jgi:protein TonB
MFDKMIETNTSGNQFKGRTRYFLVSGVIVGALFLSAVLFSIFAAEYGIGLGEINTAELLAPVFTDQPEPERPEQPQQASAPDKTFLPTRRDNMARVDEVQPVPNGISVVQNTQRARPDSGRFKISIGPETDGIGPYRSDRTGSVGTGTPTGSSSNDHSTVTETLKTKIPPPRPRQPQPPRSLGVVNGLATNLPKPVYPPQAKLMKIEGTVTVQLLIDEDGNVVSAKASGGPQMLKATAESAARKAKFTPTTLSGVPVKVTGVVRYNFKL